MTVDVFAVPVFLVVFREALETVIIVSVLLAFLKQTLDGPNRDPKVYKKLRNQVWFGTGLGFLLCLIIAAALIGVFYGVGLDKWASSEDNFEGAFSLIASLIISVMGVALLRIGQMQEKWRVKLAKAVESPMGSYGGQTWLKRFLEKYAMFILPFITVLREGIEAIVFVAGVSFSAPASSIPLATIVGLIVGAIAGYFIYKGGAVAKMQLFLVISTCFLYLVAAGLFSRAVLAFEMQEWNNVVGSDAAELGSGPGSYDISKSVWHVNCCNPELNGGGGWGFFNAIFGWTNSATYGTVISYNCYWIAIISGFSLLRFYEARGHLPLMKAKAPKTEAASEDRSETASGSAEGGVLSSETEKAA